MKVRWTLLFHLMVLLSVPLANLRAEKYALIVGVGKFLYVGKDVAHELEGPRSDAERLVQVLPRYGFDRSKMTVLLDGEGTRAAILGGIERIAAEAKAEDQVLIYFSGHGTGGLEKYNTGAIVPSDIRAGDQAVDLLIIGLRDLQPRLKKLEEKAQVLVIFDACFAGESVRSMASQNQSAVRYVSLADLTRNQVSRESLLAAERSRSTRSQAADYPYHRVVYISASSNSQPSWDISRGKLAEMHGRFSTVDGQPHGAFTNVFLKLLMDGSGSNGPCSGFYQKAATLVRDQGKLLGNPPQDPQFLFSPENAQQVASPCLTSGTAAPPTAPPSGGPAPPPPSAGPAPPPPPPSGGPATGIRAELDRIAAEATSKLKCETSKPGYRAGEATTLRCAVPEAGYLQILSYGEGDPKAVLLFPNYVQKSGAVPAGNVQIPQSGTFSIDNYLPSGKSRQEQVMLVIFTQGPVDLKSLGDRAGIFTEITERAVRSQRVVTNQYAAARLVFTISK